MDAKGGAEASGTLTAMDEVDAGDLLIAFDGRVLELFNTMDGTSKRYHVRRFALTLEGPNDKGRLRGYIKPSVGSGESRFRVDGAEVPAALELLEGVKAATEPG
jgi:hypothetical protein